MATPKAGKARGARARNDKARSASRSHVRDLGQTEHEASHGGASSDGPSGGGASNGAPSAALLAAPSAPFVPVRTTSKKGSPEASAGATQAPHAAGAAASPLLVLPGTNITLDGPEAKRPKADAKLAFPFKLGRSTDADNASMMTLHSQRIGTPLGEGPDKGALGGMADGPARDGGAADGGAANGAATGAARPPGPERFETAHELL